MNLNAERGSRGEAASSIPNECTRACVREDAKARTMPWLVDEAQKKEAT